jgi:AmiR/NasT family two-component response regulator
MSTVASLALQHATEQQRSANLQVALESSRQIGMAIGILMSSRLLTADQAFEELRRTSQQLNRKVRDVALEVNETGALPEQRDRGR